MNNIISVIFIIASVAGFSCKTERKHDKNYNNGGFFLDGIKGNDRNNGNVKNPVKTIARLNELLESKLDNVYISGGQIYDGTLIIRNTSAGEENPVSVSSVGEERAVINGGDGAAIRIEKCRHIRVSNIDIKGNEIGRASC